MRSSQPETNSNSSSQLDMAYFNEVITDSGIILNYEDTPNILTREQSIVTRDVEKSIENHVSYPSNVEEFIMGLKRLCKQEIYFKKALSSTQLRKSDDTTNATSIQESIFRIFLNVNCLQKPVTDLILEYLTVQATEDNEDTTWLKLFLNVLRYIPCIKDPSSLSTKLLDILEVATYSCQLEILNSIPEIIPDEQYDEVAKHLIIVLDQRVNLSGAIIDCLSLLHLNTSTKMKVQDCILAKMFSEQYFKIYPIVYEFLVTDCPTSNLVNMHVKFRKALDIIMTSTSNEAASNKILLLSKLQSSATSSKAICDAWIAVILNIQVHTAHIPVDLLVLFMLHATGGARKKIIENVFKRKIKAGLFKLALLENFFNKSVTSQILKDYMDSIISVGSTLLHNNSDVKMIEFATLLFKMLFNHNNVDCVQHQEILHNLILLTGTNDEKNVGFIIKIFSALLEDAQKLRKHTLQLMSILEKLDSLLIQDVKEVFEILCTLTCEGPDESVSGYKDELHMLIRKGLSSSKRITKHRGIVSAVVMTKHIARVDDDQNGITLSEDSELSLADLPEGPARDAACLLELINTCASGCPEAAGLYYDQLASMLATITFLDKYFMSWLFESITNDFQNMFVTEDTPQPIDDLQLSVQYSLNTEDEIEKPISVNIAEFVIKSKNNNLILILPPLFRLLRMLHYKQNNGDLGSIDALLGCGVIMPNTDIKNMDSEQIKHVADCIFHCINWFREVINGFVTQNNKHLRYKVIQRLNNIIELEELLQLCMNSVPEHKLPPSYFDSTVVSKTAVITSKSDSKKIKRPAKRFKSNEMVNNDESAIASTSDNTEITKTSTTRTSSSKNVFKKQEFIFREFDTDIMLLLKHPLKLTDNTEMSQTKTTQGITLNVKQFYFVLKDVVSKLDLLFSGKINGLSNLNAVKADELINDLIKFLPGINKSFKTITQEILKHLEGKGDGNEIPVFTSEIQDIKLCYSLVLECFCLLFGWSGFQHSKNISILKDCLKSLRDEQRTQRNSANSLILDFCNRLLGMTDQCLNLTSAIHLTKTIEVMYNINANADIKDMILSASGKLLRKKWYNLEGNLDTGKTACINIDYLVKSYLGGANVNTISGLVGTLQKQAPDLIQKMDTLPMLCSINKQNFHLFFRGLCFALQQRVQSELTSLTKNEHLVLWRKTALTLQGLMTIVRVQETRTNLICFLKKSIGILKLFLSHGIPILEIMLRSKPDEVVEILKTIQTTTRFLHHLCCHSKFVKDTSLMAYVPQFRLTLETLVYRVKAALVANNCSDAFWMGNLRNRGLHGEDIMTQDSTTTENDEESEEELPVDCSDDEMDVDETSSKQASTSASEVF